MVRVLSVQGFLELSKAVADHSVWWKTIPDRENLMQRGGGNGSAMGMISYITCYSAWSVQLPIQAGV